MIPFFVQLLKKKVRVTLFRDKTAGPFYARWWYKGKAYSLSTGQHQEREARTRAREMVEEAAREKSSAPVPLPEMVNRYISERWPEVDKESQKSEHGRISRILLTNMATVSAHLIANHLSYQDAITFVRDHLKRRKAGGLSKQSIINEQRHISRFFSWLMQENLVDWPANPAARRLHGKIVERVHHTPRAPVSPEELQIVLAAAKKTNIWPAVILCLSTGLRAAGCLRLKWSAVDFNAQTLAVVEKGRARVIPLNSWVVAELKAWRGKEKDDKPILNIAERMLHFEMQQIRKAKKLRPEVTLQGLRRTFISMAMDKGVSAELVASLAGNSIAVIQKHYKDLRTMNAKHVAEMMDFGNLLHGRRLSVGSKKG